MVVVACGVNQVWVVILQESISVAHEEVVEDLLFVWPLARKLGLDFLLVGRVPHGTERPQNLRIYVAEVYGRILRSRSHVGRLFPMLCKTRELVVFLYQRVVPHLAN